VTPEPVDSRGGICRQICIRTRTEGCLRIGFPRWTDAIGANASGQTSKPVGRKTDRSSNFCVQRSRRLGNPARRLLSSRTARSSLCFPAHFDVIINTFLLETTSLRRRGDSRGSWTENSANPLRRTGVIKSSPLQSILHVSSPSSTQRSQFATRKLKSTQPVLLAPAQDKRAPRMNANGR
jgi:hypothetical protein